MIYLASPKTATKSTSMYLRETHGFVRVSTKPNSRIGTLSDKTHAHHMGLVEDPNVRKGHRVGGWTIFTTVRNHWDALVSWYTYQSQAAKGVEFDKAYIVDLLGRHGTYFPEPRQLWGKHTMYATDVLRYESLEAGLSRVLGCPVVLPRENVSAAREGRHYSTFYTPALRQYVAERFAEEIERYGYVFESA